MNELVAGAEIEYLKFFYKEVCFWLADEVDKEYIEMMYKRQTGKEIPEGYRGD